MKLVAESEPPPCSSVFILGQDNRGNWIVRDQNGLRGGLFVGRAEALRYVRSEAGDRPGAVVMVNEALQLDTSGTRRPIIPHQLSAEEPRARRVA
jgi:hypothetical protein